MLQLSQTQPNKHKYLRTSLAVQWLGPVTLPVQGFGFDPWLGELRSHVPQGVAKENTAALSRPVPLSCFSSIGSLVGVLKLRGLRGLGCGKPTLELMLCTPPRGRVGQGDGSHFTDEETENRRRGLGQVTERWLEVPSAAVVGGQLGHTTPWVVVPQASPSSSLQTPWISC